MDIVATITAAPAVQANVAPRSLSSYVSGYNSLTSVCGFIAGVDGLPMVCPTDAYCVPQETSFFGCCKTAISVNHTVTSTATETSASVLHLSTVTAATSTETLSWLQGTFTFDGCNLWAPTTCYDAANASSCTGSCASSALVCSDANFPYCATYTSDPLWDSGFSTTAESLRSASPVVTGLFCDTSSYVLPVLRYSSQYQSPTYATSTALPTAGAGSISPYSRSQSSVASTAVQAPVTASSNAGERRASLVYRKLFYLAVSLVASSFVNSFG